MGEFAGRSFTMGLDVSGRDANCTTLLDAYTGVEEGVLIMLL